MHTLNVCIRFWQKKPQLCVHMIVADSVQLSSAS